MLLVGAGNALSKAMMFFANIVIANRLLEEGFGAIGVGFAIVNYFALCGFSGIDTITTREAAHNSPDSCASLATEVLLIRLVVVVAMCTCTFLAGLLISGPAGTMTQLYALTLIPQVINTVFLFYGVEWSWPIAVYYIGGRAVYLCGILLCVTAPNRAEYVPLMFGIAILVEHIFLFVMWVKRFSFCIPGISRETFRRWLPAIPVTASVSGLLLHENAALVILYLVCGSAATGIYNASYRLIYVAISLSTLLSYVYLARVTREIKENRSAAQKHFVTLCICGAIAGFICAFIGMLLSSRVVDILYKPSYRMSAALLSIGIWQMVLAPVRVISFQMLNACHAQRAAVRVIWISAALSIAIITVSIFLWDAIGAAYATVIGESIIATVLFLTARRHMHCTSPNTGNTSLSTQNVV